MTAAWNKYSSGSCIYTTHKKLFICNFSNGRVYWSRHAHFTICIFYFIVLSVCSERFHKKKKEINWRRRLTTKEILKKFCRICRKNNRVCAISHCTQSKKINIKHIWYWHTKICRFEPFFFCSLTISHYHEKIKK